MKRQRNKTTAFDKKRFRGWHMARAQAHHRGEVWELTWEEWCEFWCDEYRWNQRGRTSTSLSITRLDPEKSWNADNCVLVNRIDGLRLKAARFWGTDERQYLAGAIRIRPCSKI